MECIELHLSLHTCACVIVGAIVICRFRQQRRRCTRFDMNVTYTERCKRQIRLSDHKWSVGPRAFVIDVYFSFPLSLYANAKRVFSDILWSSPTKSVSTVILRSKILLEKPIVKHCLNQGVHYCVYNSAIWPCPEPVESGSHSHILFM